MLDVAAFEQGLEEAQKAGDATAARQALVHGSCHSTLPRRSPPWQL
jgi:hypothetical protein